MQVTFAQNISRNLTTGIGFLSGRNILRPVRPYEILDPKIKDLVDVMNSTGNIQTIASCEGHGTPSFAPYVYFKAPVTTVSSIKMKMREDYMQESSKLYYYWDIDGKFNAESNLVFLLYSPELDWASSSHIKCFFRFYLFRKRVDQDISVLKNLVLEHADKFRECEKVAVS